MNKNRESLFPKPRTLTRIPAPPKLTQPKTPSFCKPRISVARHTGNPTAGKADLPSNRLSLNFNNLKRGSVGIKPGKPSSGLLKPINRSFGFLKPTRSSMAKQHSGKNLPGKLESVREVVEPRKKVNEAGMMGKGARDEKALESIISSVESLDVCATVSEINESAPSTLSNSFIIFEGADEESPATKFTANEISPIKNNVNPRRQTIIPTPKFPKCRSVEKNTKRKLSFVPISQRNGCPQERLRSTYSPPPDFDVTINSATSSPSYVPPAANYDRFCTPIMNLTAALSITDDDEDESVYYTPCAEI